MIKSETKVIYRRLADGLVFKEGDKIYSVRDKEDKYLATKILIGRLLQLKLIVAIGHRTISYYVPDEIEGAVITDSNNKEFVNISDTQENTVPNVLNKNVGFAFKYATEGTLKEVLKKIEEIKEDKVKVNFRKTLEKLPIEYYINLLAKKNNVSFKDMDIFLGNMYQIDPSAAIGLILRVIAVELDKQYADHIENSPEIYAISMLNGKINKIEKSYIKTYKGFAAFRSIDDAKIACKLLSNKIRFLFKNARK